MERIHWIKVLIGDLTFKGCAGGTWQDPTCFYLSPSKSVVEIRPFEPALILASAINDGAKLSELVRVWVGLEEKLLTMPQFLDSQDDVTSARFYGTFLPSPPVVAPTLIGKTPAAVGVTLQQKGGYYQGSAHLITLSSDFPGAVAIRTPYTQEFLDLESAVLDLQQACMSFPSTSRELLEHFRLPQRISRFLQ